MAAIKLQQFRGVRPRLGQRHLDDREATVAVNVRLGSGELRALRGATTDAAWAKAGAISSFFPMEFVGGRKWLHWPADIDALRGPVPNDTHQRVYYTGDGAPKMTYNALVDAAVGVAGEYPRDWRYLGMPAPSNVLTVDATDFGTEGEITALVTPRLIFRFAPRLAGTPKALSQGIKIMNGGSKQAFTVFPPGAEYLVEAVNENTLRLYTLDGGQYLTEAIEALEGWTYFYEKSNGSDSSATALNGTLALPNGSIVAVANHGLRDGDVIRITGVTAPLTYESDTSYGTGLTSTHEITTANDEHAVIEFDATWSGNITYSVVRDFSTVSGRVVERTYIYTYVTPLGEEGPPSDPSTIVSTVEEDPTRVTNFVVPTLSQREIEFVRLYRANNSSTDAEFQFVAEIAAADITGYTQQNGADVTYGGTIAFPALQIPLALDGTIDNTVVATEPVNIIKTRRDTPVTLTLRVTDSETNLNMPAQNDLTAPNWQIDFQYSTNGSLWITLATRNALGTASNTQEDTVPITYTSSLNLDETVVETFDVASAPVSKGDDVQYRAVLRLVAGDYNTPALHAFSAEEAVVLEPGEPGPATYTYEDSIADVSLGEVIESVTWFPPDERMQGIVSMPNGILAGFFNRTVAFCEPYYPHAWPPEYELHVDYDIVGLGVYGNSLVIATTGTPYTASGTHSRNMRGGLRRIEVNQACVAKNSIANIGSGVLYATPDGLAYASNEGFRIITEAYLSREEWQELNPESIVGFAHDQRYIAFFNNGGAYNSFMFDPVREDVGMAFAEVSALGGYEDLLTDTLYLSDGSNRQTWDTGGALAYTWRSKLFAFPYPMNPAFGRVVAAGYPVTFRLYANGVLRHERSVASSDEFRLPGGYMADQFMVEIATTQDVSAVYLGETVEDVMAG